MDDPDWTIKDAVTESIQDKGLQAKDEVQAYTANALHLGGLKDWAAQDFLASPGGVLI